MTPHEFIAKWKPVTLTERSACQQHFLDLCELLGQPKPAAADPDGAWYTFERGVSKTGGGPLQGAIGATAPGCESDWSGSSERPARSSGWADVWMRGRFGWEYDRNPDHFWLLLH